MKLNKKLLKFLWRSRVASKADQLVQWALVISSHIDEGENAIRESVLDSFMEVE